MPGGRHRAGRSIGLEEMDAAAVARRQIHLCRQRVAQRRTERADIGDERSVGIGQRYAGHERGQRRNSHEGGGCLQKRASGRQGTGHIRSAVRSLLQAREPVRESFAHYPLEASCDTDSLPC